MKGIEHLPVIVSQKTLVLNIYNTYTIIHSVIQLDVKVEIDLVG